MLSPRERLIVALDLGSVAEAEAMVARLGDTVSFYKIGYRLAFLGGLDFARALADAGKKIFIDMKLHDTGNTVAQGVVCSGAEASALRPILGRAMVLVTPGIRPVGAESGDQKRIVTPSAAIAAGADYMVVGRPIIAASDPRAAAEAILAEIAAAAA